MSTRDDLDPARAQSLPNPPAWQESETGQPHPAQVTLEEFKAEFTADLWKWIPKEPRTRSSWWLYVQQFAEKRFNEAYEKDFPKQ